VENENETIINEGAGVYEIGYLLTPLLPEEKATEVIETTVKGFIEQLGGTMTSQPLMPKIRPLAYAVAKMINNKRSIFKEAYFGALRFEGEGATAEAVKALLDKQPEIIRYLILKIPKSALRVNPRRAEKPSREIGEDGEVKMTEAEIDQEIEGLLTTAE
jgi:ribosomal protein S6